MSSIINIQSVSSYSRSSSTTLLVDGLVYIFVSAAAKRQVARRLRQGYSLNSVLRWAMGLGNDPLVSETPQESIDSREYETVTLGTNLPSSGYVDFPTEPEWDWVWESLAIYSRQGLVRPEINYPGAHEYIVAQWKELVNIYWDLLSIFPMDMPYWELKFYAQFVQEEQIPSYDYFNLSSFSKWRGVWREDWEGRDVMGGRPYALEYKFPMFQCIQENASKEMQELFLHNWNWWYPEFLEKVMEVEDDERDYGCKPMYTALFTLRSWINNCQKIVELEDFSSTIEGWVTLTNWYLQAPALDTDGVESRFYPYSTNILKLASNKKQKEVRQGGKLMYGVELEFCHSDYSLKELFPLTHMGVFKYDSSVDGEYVTLPYVPEEMVSKIEGLSGTFDKLLSANGWDGCGMHVHVSRAALSEQQMLNLQYLLNPSTEEGKDYWEMVADRELRGNEYCDFLGNVTEDTYMLYGVSRYVLLNFKNEHTVEFRMFKAPTSAAKVLWNLSVVKGLLEFSKNSNSLEEWMESPLNPMNS